MTDEEILPLASGKIGQHATVAVEVLETPWDVYNDIARVMADTAPKLLKMPIKSRRQIFTGACQRQGFD